MELLLERWWRTGVRGAILQTYLIGHRRYTTLAAIKRFIDDQQVGQMETNPKTTTNARREHAINKAEENVRKQLER